MRRLLPLLLVLLSLCCSPPAPAPKLAHYDAPVEVLWLHVDQAFTAAERDAVNEAAERIELQTRGMLWVVLNYDLDFTDISSTTRHASDDVLMRMDSRNKDDAGAILTSEILSGTPRGHMLGVKFSDPSRGGSMTLWLVVDRITTHKWLVSVAMHEMLHGLGLQHITASGALMNPAPTVTCLHEADVKELCSRYQCEPREIGWCEGP